MQSYLDMTSLVTIKTYFQAIHVLLYNIEHLLAIPKLFVFIYAYRGSSVLFTNFMLFLEANNLITLLMF